MNNFIELYQRSLQNQIKTLEWDLKYYQENSPEIMKDEILKCHGKIFGLKMALKLIEETVKNIEMSIKMNESLDNMNSLLDKMDTLISKK